MSMQVANEASLCTEESYTVRTRKCGGRGQYGSAFSKLPVLFSCCFPFCFSCLTTSHHLFLSCTRHSRLLGLTLKDFMETFSVCMYVCVCIYMCVCVCIYIYIYYHPQTISLYHNSSVWLDKDGCCRSKERIRIYFKIGRSTKRFVFFEFIYFVLTYMLYIYICMFPACCFHQRTCGTRPF